jgi:hypothetical protein
MEELERTKKSLMDDEEGQRSSDKLSQKESADIKGEWGKLSLFSRFLALPPLCSSSC